MWTLPWDCLLYTSITRGITRPIKELEAAARQMEQGHLKIDVNYASKDELGSLSDSMRQMSDKISYYMDAISRVMRQLADSNLEIPHYDDFQGDFLPVQESLLIVLNSLNEIISEINMFSDQVANGADQVSNEMCIRDRLISLPGRPVSLHQ